MLLQIGEFARLTNLPVRTIRYYGDLGLLPPAEVDPSSGYRKYRIDQVERVAQLVALKEDSRAGRTKTKPSAASGTTAPRKYARKSARSSPWAKIE